MGSYQYGVAPMKFGYPTQTGTTTQQSATTDVGARPRPGQCDRSGDRSGFATDATQQSGSERTGQAAGSGRGHHHGRFGGSDAQYGFHGLDRTTRAFGGGGWYPARQRLSSSQFADQAFGRFDTDGNGQITRDELIAALDAMRGAATTSTATATTTSTDAASVDAVATTDVRTDATPTTETVVDTSTDTTSTDTTAEDALAALLATTDTTTEVPTAPVTDDGSGGSVV